MRTKPWAWHSGRVISDLDKRACLQGSSEGEREPGGGGLGERHRRPGQRQCFKGVLL